jgi:hypothetical protein
MTLLLIKDLSFAETMDRQAACAVRGGMALDPSVPDTPLPTPGIAAGGCLPQPLPPGFAAMPSWMKAFWAPAPAEREPDTNVVNLSQHQSTTP